MQTTLSRAARAAAASASSSTLVSRSFPLLSSVLVASAVGTMSLSHRTSIQVPAFLSAISTASLFTSTRGMKPVVGVVTAAPYRSFSHVSGALKESPSKMYEAVRSSLPSGSRVTRTAKDQAWRDVWNRNFHSRALLAMPCANKLPFVDSSVVNAAQPALMPVVPTYLLTAGAGADGPRESTTMIGSGARDFHSARHVEGNAYMSMDPSTTVFQARLNRTLERVETGSAQRVVSRPAGQDLFALGANLPVGVSSEKQYTEWLAKYVFNPTVLGPDTTFVQDVTVRASTMGSSGRGFADGIVRFDTPASMPHHLAHGLRFTHAVIETKKDPQHLVAAQVQGLAYWLSDTIINEMLAMNSDGEGEPYSALVAIAGPYVTMSVLGLEAMLRVREARDAGETCTPRVPLWSLTAPAYGKVVDPFQTTLMLNHLNGPAQMAGLLQQMRNRSIVMPN
ncbi:hypothetical protein AMAG_12947 [Allomyces macrogynus ATCC 38327]|uniref:Uncharacterized protein n=1 Tax=Allomyces macrogynus (strain ATCC 38327) TaxID=578462 RepID=A0A0L0T0G4_ALLM3|nr:hypothetical protein AMAG_12947 [Allomyces macrogynus ATCC 38327]|eukprot:KNE68278.1 hypothetical protein AMAG_12947 [Allomyces macrogynus ATCC 38327]